MKMKKILLFLTVAVLGLTGCKDDEKITDLTGTTWKAYEIQEIRGTTYEWGSTITFTSDTRFTASFFNKEDGVTTDSDQQVGTYVYNPPKVTLTVAGESVTGTVNQKRIVVHLDGSDEETVYTRQ